MIRTIVFLSSLAAALALAGPAAAGDCERIGEARIPGATTGKGPSKPQPGAETRIDVTAGAPVKTEGGPGAMVQANVAVQQAAPDRTRADSLFYLSLGGSGVAARGLHGGPGLGLGYRMELDHVGIDASMNIALDEMAHKESRGIAGSWVKLTGQYYFTPAADRSPYLGGGLSYGGTIASILDARFSGSGLQGEIVGGYELLRSSTIRMFLQASVTLPFYMGSREGAPATPLPASHVSVPAMPDQRYLPSMGLSFGIGWGSTSSVNVKSP